MMNRIVWCTILVSIKITASTSSGSLPPPTSATSSRSSSGETTSTSTSQNPHSQPSLDSLPYGTSYPLQDKQCEVGTRIAISPLDFAEANRLYIDTENPATCSGRVALWELCYQTRGLDLSSTFDLLLLNKVNNVYNVHAIHTVTVDQNIEETTGLVSCDYIPAMDLVSISTGDYIGFVCNKDISIGFSPNQDNSLSNLHQFNLSKQAFDIDSIRSDELQRINTNVVHQLRIIIDITDETVPTKAPCENGPPTIWTPVFTSVVIASVVVIFVLFLIVFLMGCCLCKCKFKCCKYFTRCCRCWKKKGVVHRITVEPITDQSMQYNDLYIPHDPSQIITDGQQHRVNFRGNPAYDTPQSNRYSAMIKATPSQDALSTATELSTLDHCDAPRGASNKSTSRPDSTMLLPLTKSSVTSDMDLDMKDIFEESREFDHTYEMIHSGKIVK